MSKQIFSQSLFFVDFFFLQEGKEFGGFGVFLMQVWGFGGSFVCSFVLDRCSFLMQVFL